MTHSGPNPEENPSEEVSGAFDMIPKEILLIILTQLGIKSFSIFIKLAQISRKFRHLINEPQLWRELNNKYFPYIQESNPEGLRVNPKEIFKAEYLRYKTDDQFHAWNVGMSRALASLGGEIASIEPPVLQAEQSSTSSLYSPGLDRMCKIHLYQLALANGDYSVWSNLDRYQRKCAFSTAAENGRLAVVRWFLVERGADIFGAERAIALRLASKHQHSHVVQCILDNSQGPEFEEQLKTEVRFVLSPTLLQIQSWATLNNCQGVIEALNNVDVNHHQRPAV